MTIDAELRPRQRHAVTVEVSSFDEADVVATLLGDREFGLMYVFPSPEAYLGHRVETKGLLIRDEAGGGPAGLNVTSVQSLAAVCEP